MSLYISYDRIDRSPMYSKKTNKGKTSKQKLTTGSAMVAQNWRDQPRAGSSHWASASLTSIPSGRPKVVSIEEEEIEVSPRPRRGDSM